MELHKPITSSNEEALEPRTDQEEQLKVSEVSLEDFKADDIMTNAPRETETTVLAVDYPNLGSMGLVLGEPLASSNDNALETSVDQRAQKKESTIKLETLKEDGLMPEHNVETETAALTKDPSGSGYVALELDKSVDSSSEKPLECMSDQEKQLKEGAYFEALEEVRVIEEKTGEMEVIVDAEGFSGSDKPSGSGNKMSESLGPHFYIDEDVSNESGMPKVDMEFENDVKAYWFYTKYATEVGFSVRKHRCDRSLKGVITSRMFVCYREGYLRTNKGERQAKKPRPSERIGCPAHMTIKITNNGRYRVSEFQPNHNHELVTPVKAQMLKSQRILTEAQNALGGLPDDSETTPKVSYDRLESGDKMSKALQPYFSMEDIIATDSEIPKVDMEFENDEKAYWFYTKYAIEIGFSVRKYRLDRSTNGIITSRTFVCNKEGYYGNNEGEHRVRKPRPSERTGCPARMTIKLTKNDRYRVSEFQPIHNHELVTPIKAHMLKSQRRLTEAQAAVTDLVYESETTPKTFTSRESGGCQHIGFPQIEYNNYLQPENALKLGDAGVMMDTPLLSEPDKKGIILIKERELILKQRDSALQEAQQWRIELTKARERVVVLEAAVFRAEEKANILEADAEAKLKDATKEKYRSLSPGNSNGGSSTTATTAAPATSSVKHHWRRQQQYRQQRQQQRQRIRQQQDQHQQRQQHLQQRRQQRIESNAEPAIEEKSESCSGADSTFPLRNHLTSSNDNVDQTCLSDSRLVNLPDDCAVPLTVVGRINMCPTIDAERSDFHSTRVNMCSISDAEQGDFHSKDARIADGNEISPVEESSSQVVGKACFSDSRLVPVSGTGIVPMTIDRVDTHPISDNERCEIRPKDSRITDGKEIISLEAEGSSSDVPVEQSDKACLSGLNLFHVSGDSGAQMGADGANFYPVSDAEQSEFQSRHERMADEKEMSPEAG